MAASAVSASSIKIQNLSFSFPKKLIFKNVNLDITTNSVSLLTGANGSGKTTFCRLLSGLQTGYSGEIISPTKLLYLKQSAETNLLAATPALDLSLWSNVNCKIKNVKLREILNYFDLNEKADQPVWELSGGEQQRLVLSALLLHPDHFWLLDEPAAGLDDAQQKKLLQLLQEHKNGALIVSHRKELFAPVTTQVFTIADWKIIKQSTDGDVCATSKLKPGNINV
ncbi:MAG: ATP-binding cassette domain-containing protein [Candidatus Cloacimonetes bacterium]|nr:ATP-binding cassette domain-containing protein [Candidatus Cloacimonadota bacterium]